MKNIGADGHLRLYFSPIYMITIREGHIEEVVALSNELEEFNNPYPAKEYYRRFSEVPYLILVACEGDKVVGFKVGYQRDNDGSFYSWMGGIHPLYRRKGVARMLAEQQERWAREKGYKCIRFKTRNRLKAMQIFALSRGFDIIDLKPEKELSEYRIWLEKKL